MYLFVYGSLKLHCLNNDKLKNAKFVCATHTSEMYLMLDLGNFPGAFRGEDESSFRSNIYGEVYEIDYDTIKCLDEFEGIWFTREMVPIQCGISVWMYFLNALPDEYEVIETGIWGN
ncbi:MAG TPA: gamma-glutamylcyclotransferase [Methanosarcinaceae archaeon]|nr:gamma-glutamylcyclotransferase [Methanosarcinaceae archaeon]